MDDEPFAGAEQLGGDHERADRVIGRSAAGVADHMGVAFGKACVLGGVEPGVHAGEDGKSPRGRHGELALVAETGRIGFVSGEHFLQDWSHDESLLEKRPLCSYLFRSNSNSRNDDSSVKRSCPQTPARTAMVIFDLYS